MYQITLLGGLAAFGISLVAGVLGALILGRLGSFSLFALFYAPAIGPALGKLIIRASGGKSGTKLAFIGAAGFAVGGTEFVVGNGSTILAARRPSGGGFCRPCQSLFVGHGGHCRGFAVDVFEVIDFKGRRGAQSALK